MSHLFSTSPVLPGANTRIRESRVSIQCSHHHLPLFLSGSSKDISVSVIDFIFVLACATPVCQPITVCAFGSCHTPCRCKGKSCVVFTLSQFLPRGNICLLRQRIWGWDDVVSPPPFSFPSLVCSEGSPSHRQVCLLGQRNQEKKLENVGEDARKKRVLLWNVYIPNSGITGSTFGFFLWFYFAFP